MSKKQESKSTFFSRCIHKKNINWIKLKSKEHRIPPGKVIDFLVEDARLNELSFDRAVMDYFEQ